MGLLDIESKKKAVHKEVQDSVQDIIDRYNAGSLTISVSDRFMKLLLEDVKLLSIGNSFTSKANYIVSEMMQNMQHLEKCKLPVEDFASFLTNF